MPALSKAEVLALKETGIMMVDEMTQKAIADIKTQTRRVITLNHYKIVRVSNRYEFATSGPHTLSLKETPDWHYVQVESIRKHNMILGIPCPYGRPGMRLYLKEDHRLTRKKIDGKLCIIAEYRFNYEDTGFRQYKWEDLDKATRRKLSKIKTWGKWRSKLLMYKFLARVRFEITAIRVEPVQKISPEDALREGTQGPRSFAVLWDSINGKRGKKKRNLSWSANPWVWVLVFKRLKGIA